LAESGLVAFVPEAEPLVGCLRLRYDESARMGVSAHITLLFPFMEPSLVTAAVVQDCSTVLASHKAFSFELRSVGRFPVTAYLVPQPAEPFIELTQALCRAFPAYSPFGGKFPSVIPHLTVAHGNAVEADAAATALSASLQSSGPVSSVCRSVVLIENSSGRWRPTHVFPLAPAPRT
jgi:2'-5' RNA ligase